MYIEVTTHDSTHRNPKFEIFCKQGHGIGTDRTMLSQSVLDLISGNNSQPNNFLKNIRQ
jgi:hypothetical protein